MISLTDVGRGFLEKRCKHKRGMLYRKRNQIKRRRKQKGRTISMNPILVPYASLAAKPSVLPSVLIGLAGDIEKSTLVESALFQNKRRKCLRLRRTIEEFGARSDSLSSRGLQQSHPLEASWTFQRTGRTKMEHEHRHARRVLDDCKPS